MTTSGLPLLALPILLAGCGSPSSTDIPLDAIQFNVVAQSNGALAQIFVTLDDARSETHAPVALGEGDALFFGATGGLAQVLTARRLDGIAGPASMNFENPARLDGVADPPKAIFLAPTELLYLGQVATASSQLTLTLIRLQGDKISVALELPLPFTVTPPPSPSSRKQPLTFTWASQGGESISLFSPCLPSSLLQPLPPGTETFTIDPTQFVGAGGDCPLDVQVGLDRSSIGTSPPPHLDFFDLLQVRTSTISTIP